ncbi:hypothetical protein ACZ90_42730 [Streptomyces albus subsp. albus]|nr:hypothetical protein ACZ90_42730 [Streptomyces albus subsp. albus]
MKQLMGIIGVIVAIQGVLGLAGLLFGDEAWGALHNWFDLPTLAYLGITAAGLALVAWSEHGRTDSA